MSRSEAAELNLPAGFRFHPTDEELVVEYLCRKCTGLAISAPIIAEIDLYRYNPWQLPELALYGEKEWYFFSPRDRKYPNGCRPNRAAGSGYWKATGVDKPIGKPKPLGIKKALVFYSGKAPKGIKTNWIMHEYRLANVDRSAGRNTSLRLDDWVLCRIYNKKKSNATIQKVYNTTTSSSVQKTPNFHEMMDPDEEDHKPTILNNNNTPSQINYNTAVTNNEMGFRSSTFFQPPSDQPPPLIGGGLLNNNNSSDIFHFDSSDSSIHRYQNTDQSSGSEHMLSSSEVITCDREVQSGFQMNGLNHQFYGLSHPFDDSSYSYQVKFEEQDMEGNLPYSGDIFAYLP